MADISVTPKQGGSRTWIWVVIAVVAVVGLMLWLASQPGTTSPTPVVDEDTTAAVVPDSLAAADTLAADSAAVDSVAQ